MLHFQVGWLENQIRPTQFTASTRLVPVSYLQNKSNVHNLEDIIIHVRVLSVTVGKKDRQATFNHWSQSGMKRKNPYTAPFSRWILVADIANPPNCAVIVSRTSNESSYLFEKTAGKRIIGRDYYIYEPNLTKQTMGTGTPILSVENRQLLPLRDHIIGNIPETTILNPRDLDIGQGGHFVLKQRSVHLSRTSIFQDCSCTGIQCDRQKQQGECSCLFANLGKTYVYSFDVSTTLMANELNLNTETLTVSGFKSLFTTKCFFRDYEDRVTRFNEEADLVHEIRPRVATMTNCINTRGGWTMVGWYKRGDIADASSGDRIESQDVTVHISYLGPSDLDILHTPGYLALMIGTNEPTEAMEQAAQQEQLQANQVPLNNRQQEPEE